MERYKKGFDATQVNMRFWARPMYCIFAEDVMLLIKNACLCMSHTFRRLPSKLIPMTLTGT